MAHWHGWQRDFTHKGKPIAPAHRLQKIDPEIEPQITQVEKLPRNLPLPGQLVPYAEFERATESQGIVDHQSQPDQQDRPGRRQ